ncbi:MAG: hypothetical protein JF593_07265 [Novosphingobium sp.]|nr:hypothetical protein [Novosphingobium sp.]
MQGWPALDYAASRDTLETLHLWLQIAGKVRLKLTPWINHGWSVTLAITARGLSTGPMPSGDALVELEFDFIEHRLIGCTSGGTTAAVKLEPQGVAVFYRKVREMLDRLGVQVAIYPVPSEVADPIPFAVDEAHESYDPAAVHGLWRALVCADRVLKQFRTGFLGKVSPVQLFWGGFDLAVTRFSGRPAPLHPGGIPGLPDRITREAYSHEVSSAGFWLGDARFPEAAFYSYAYPEPAGFRAAAVPPPARYVEELGEFILPYDAVRAASEPEALLLAFFDSTYRAAADGGGWDRAALECASGRPGVPRTVG